MFAEKNKPAPKNRLLKLPYLLQLMSCCFCILLTLNKISETRTCKSSQRIRSAVGVAVMEKAEGRFSVFKFLSHYPRRPFFVYPYRLPYISEPLFAVARLQARGLLQLLSNSSCIAQLSLANSSRPCQISLSSCVKLPSCLIPTNLLLQAVCLVDAVSPTGILIGIV